MTYNGQKTRSRRRRYVTPVIIIMEGGSQRLQIYLSPCVFVSRVSKRSHVRRNQYWKRFPTQFGSLPSQFVPDRCPGNKDEKTSEAPTTTGQDKRNGQVYFILDSSRSTRGRSMVPVHLKHWDEICTNGSPKPLVTTLFTVRVPFFVGGRRVGVGHKGPTSTVRPYPQDPRPPTTNDPHSRRDCLVGKVGSGRNVGPNRRGQVG